MNTHSSKRHVHGMTLVEVLVAITLGLLVIAGIGQIYTATKRSYDIQSNMARLQDVGRYAIETISQDIRRAGFWGLTDMRALPPGHPYELADADGTCSSTISSWARMVRQPIFGLNDAVTNYDCIPTSDHSRGDVLVVHYADPIAVTTYDGDHLYIRTAPYKACITWGNPDISATPPSADIPLPKTPPPPLPPSCPAVGIPFSDHRIIAHGYYVSDVRGASSPTCNGIPIPSLSREEAGTLGKPVRKGLVAGVEDLQFQYGVNTDATPSVDQFLNANAIGLFPIVPNWDQVIAVRVWVLVRAECPEGGYVNNTTYVFGDRSYTPNDNYRRQLYSTTVALRN